MMKACGESRTVTASEFRSRCLGLMDELAADGGEIVITKRGRPVARLLPYMQRAKTLFGIDRGKLKILGDVVSPIDVEWYAESDPDRVVNP